MLHLIVGPIVTLQEKALQQLKSQYPDAEAQLHFGSELDFAVLSAALQNLSLFGPAPLIVLREADALSKPDQERLLKCEIPREQGFILCATSTDKRLKFWQHFLAKADVHSAEAPAPKDRRAWVQAACRERGWIVAADAMNALQELAQDFMQLLSTLEKLELYLGSSKQVSLEAVQLCQAGGASTLVFGWTEALAGQKWHESFQILRKLWAQQEAPLALLALLTRHLRILLKTLEKKSLWSRQGDMARELGVPPFTVERYLAQAKLWSQSQLKKSWDLLLHTERALKSSPLPKELELEALVWKLKALLS